MLKQPLDSKDNCKLIDTFCLDLGYLFNDKTILLNALNRNAKTGNFQNSEFLGDAVLYTVIADVLEGNNKQAKVGKLSEARRDLINNKGMLCEVAKKLGLEKIIIRAPEEKSHKITDDMYGDAMEAVIGAVFRDGGYKAAKRIIIKHWQKGLDSIQPRLDTTTVTINISPQQMAPVSTSSRNENTSPISHQSIATQSSSSLITATLSSQTGMSTSKATLVNPSSPSTEKDIFQVIASGRKHVQIQLPNLKNQLHTQDADGRNPLIYALDINASAKTIKYLINAGCNREQTDKKGRNFNNIVQNNPSKYKKLAGDLFPKQVVQKTQTSQITPLSTNSTIISTSTTSQNSASTVDVNKRLFEITSCKKKETIEKVLKEAIAKKVNLNAQNTGKKGQTPLMIALKNKNYPCAALLVKYGADWNASDRKGRCPSDIVVDKKLPEEEITKIKNAAIVANC